MCHGFLRGTFQVYVVNISFTPWISFAERQISLQLMNRQLLWRFHNCYRNRYSHTNHWVVTCADKSHHFNVSRNWWRTCELSITMHSTHSICHTVRSIQTKIIEISFFICYNSLKLILLYCGTIDKFMYIIFWFIYTFIHKLANIKLDTSWVKIPKWRV